jgi:hypothetical protein
MDPLLEAEALSVLSWLVIWTGDALATSVDCLQRSNALVEKEQGTQAARIRADNLYTSGILAIVRGDLSQAELLGRQCLEAYEAIGSEFGMAEACIVLYGSTVRRGELETARRWTDMGVALRRKLGDLDGLAGDLTIGALARFSLADYEGAKQMLAEVLQIGLGTRNTYSQGLAICFLGMTCLVDGEPGQSLDYFSQHAALAGETNDARYKTFNIYYVAWLLLRQGQYRPALQLIGAFEVSNRFHTVVIAYEIPAIRDAIQQYRQEARQALGEAEYNAAYAEGRLLSLDQAVALGLRQAEAALRS